MNVKGCFISEFETIDDCSVQFKINRCPSKIANGLRRVLIAETPTMALELIDIYENTSVLHSDFICHRLGLLPLNSNTVDKIIFKHECDCEHCCERCSVHFKCDVTNDTHKNITVTNGDLIPINNTNNEGWWIDGLDSIPILKLAPKQTITFNAMAQKGTGKEHSKWSPVCSCVCTYSVDEGADNLTQFEQNNNPDTFDFTLETVESIKPQKALQLGFDVLIDKLVKFEKTLKTLKIK